MTTTSWFDRFADKSEEVVAHAGFFSFCVLLVVVWAPTLLFLNIDTSQLLINTATTIITFLLVALLQNTQKRFEDSVCAKLDAQTKALVQLLLDNGESTIAVDLLKSLEA